MNRGLLWSSLVFLCVSCTDDAEVTYEQFNASDEDLIVAVGDEVGAVQEIVMFSNTGTVEIGVGSVDPDSGPVGTVHTIEVSIYDSWAHMVDGVDISVSSSERVEQEFSLVSDSAEEGLYRLEITSAGYEDEARTDTITLLVLDIVGDADESDTAN
jgi:hypothetical protein